MVEIRRAAGADADVVAEMIVSLLTELTGEPHEKNNYIDVTKMLLETPHLYSVYVAYNSVDEAKQSIGVIQ